MKPGRPTAADLEAARTKTVKDVIRPGLEVLFVGLNPGLYSAAIGQHFGRPGNRFWPALNRSGLLHRPLTPYDSRRLLESNLGITNIVDRTTTPSSVPGRASACSGRPSGRRGSGSFRTRAASTPASKSRITRGCSGS